MKHYIPQIIMIVLYAVDVVINAAKHGEPKGDSYNFWATLLATAASISILAWGGFWK